MFEELQEMGKIPGEVVRLKLPATFPYTKLVATSTDTRSNPICTGVAKARVGVAALPPGEYAALERFVTCNLCTQPTQVPKSKLLSHTAFHILEAEHSSSSSSAYVVASQPCGFCGILSESVCKLARKGNSQQVNVECKTPAGVAFQFGTASKSTAANPSTNMVLPCSLCDPPALVWKYNFKEHCLRLHPTEAQPSTSLFKKPRGGAAGSEVETVVTDEEKVKVRDFFAKFWPEHSAAVSSTSESSVPRTSEAI